MALVERASIVEKEREQLGNLLRTLVKAQQSLDTFSLESLGFTEAEVEFLNYRLF